MSLRYELYTMRRTSTRTVYAIYDNYGTNQPITTTDHVVAMAWQRDWNRNGAPA